MGVRLFNIEITDIKKYLPSHLIPNEYILKMEKEKYYGSETKNDITISNSSNKYTEYINLLQEDLRKSMDNNLSLSNEISEVEEERQYYLGKLIKVINFCDDIKQENIDSDTKLYLDNILQIIKHIPEDFK